MGNNHCLRRHLRSIRCPSTTPRQKGCSQGKHNFVFCRSSKPSRTCIEEDCYLSFLPLYFLCCTSPICKLFRTICRSCIADNTAKLQNWSIVNDIFVLCLVLPYSACAPNLSKNQNKSKEWSVCSNRSAIVSRCVKNVLMPAVICSFLLGMLTSIHCGTDMLQLV